jgi:hypothetical protein
MPAGRPSLYTEELADQICELIMAGKTLIGIASLEDFPSPATICRWMHDKPEFESKCTRARLMQAELMDEMILQVADAVDEDNFQASKVRLSAYQWRAAKLAPKRFGERIHAEHTGKDGGAMEFVVKSILEEK